MLTVSPRNNLGEYWIEDDELRPGGLHPMGPYSTQAAAESDRVGVTRMLAHENDRKFFTRDK